jgi:hypothetical protein
MHDEWLVPVDGDETQRGPPPVTKRTLYRSGTAISSLSLENCVD